MQQITQTKNNLYSYRYQRNSKEMVSRLFLVYITYILLIAKGNVIISSSNVFAYDYSKSDVVEESIAKVLTDELYIGYDTTDFQLSRLDLGK